MIQNYPAIHAWHHDVRHGSRMPILIGATIIVVWACGFGLWAGLAPLASAVVAPGSFVATGQNKQVQHLEGGIIRQLLVREGDIVDANQPLVRLDDTAALSKLHRLVTRRSRLMATAARLRAEIDFSDKIVIPAKLETAMADDQEVQAIVQSQQAELTARRRSLLNQEAVSTLR